MLPSNHADEGRAQSFRDCRSARCLRVRRRARPYDTDTTTFGHHKQHRHSSTSAPGLRGYGGIGFGSALSALATLANGHTFDVSQLAVWQSSDSSIVKVDGRSATGLKLGGALLTASYQGKVGSRLVTTRKCISWDLYAPPLMWLGQSVRFSTTAYNACSLNPTTVSPTWSTNYPDIAIRYSWATPANCKGKRSGLARLRGGRTSRRTDTGNPRIDRYWQ